MKSYRDWEGFERGFTTHVRSVLDGKLEFDFERDAHRDVYVLNCGRSTFRFNWKVHRELGFMTLVIERYDPQTRFTSYTGVETAESSDMRLVFEAFREFAGRYKVLGEERVFYGFGVGWDAQIHRRIGELTGLKGLRLSTGTRVTLQGVLQVDVPHPFFLEKGMRVESVVLKDSHSSVADLRGHVEKLRRALEQVELIERVLT